MQRYKRKPFQGLLAVQLESWKWKVADADQGTAIPAVTEPKLYPYTLRSSTSEVLGKDSKLPSQIILLKNMDDKRRLIPDSLATHNV